MKRQLWGRERRERRYMVGNGPGRPVVGGRAVARDVSQGSVFLKWGASLSDARIPLSGLRCANSAASAHKSIWYL
jgi:hypothetical protein